MPHHLGGLGELLFPQEKWETVFLGEVHRSEQPHSPTAQMG